MKIALLYNHNLKTKDKRVFKILSVVGFLLLSVLLGYYVLEGYNTDAQKISSTSPSKELIKVRDYESKTLEVLTDLANNGDAEAQNTLGKRYMNGIGVEPDILTSKKWYLQAAEQGHGYAQHSLGFIYLFGKRQSGQSIEKDSSKAIEWLTKAANSDSAVSVASMNTLANIYIDGHIVAKDVDKGISLLSKVADAGNGMAANMIAVMYHDGRDVKKDYKKAIKWYEKALSLGYGDAQHSLNDLQGTNKPIPGVPDVINITNPGDRVDFEEILGFEDYVQDELRSCGLSGQLRAVCICEVYDEILEWEELVQDFAKARPDWHGKTLKYSSKTKNKAKNIAKSRTVKTNIEAMQGHLRNMTQTTCD